PADILEIDIDAVRTGGRELLREIGGAMVDAGVEAELFADETALRIATGDADCAAALDPGDLSNDRADRAGGGGNHHGRALLRPSALAEAHVGGHARHAEHPERAGERRPLGVELAQARPVRGRVFLPAPEAEHDIARRILRMARAHHLADGATDHRLADL